MRKLLLAVFLYSGLIFGQNSQEVEKIYVSPDQIDFMQNSILVQVDNQWLAVESLHVDKNGIFAIKDQKETDWLHWKCPICNTINSITDNYCVNCGN